MQYERALIRLWCLLEVGIKEYMCFCVDYFIVVPHTTSRIFVRTLRCTRAPAVPAMSIQVGVGMMLMVMGCNIYISKWIGYVEKNNLKCADTRIGILSEIISSIKAVKFFAWEHSYEEKITRARLQECKSIQKFRSLQVLCLNY